MKQKVFISGLCLTLALSLVSCGGQQTGPEPQEPKQEVQQTEPVTTEPTVEPMEVKQEVEPVNPTAPVEEEQDTGDKSDSAVTDGEAEPAVQLFTDVEETVYATGTVNIRASYTAESEKLGSLSRGQSVTRTGTSIQGTEAEGWSRVELSDGSTAYISNKYLSTTKPVDTKPQQSKPSTSTGTSTSSSSNNQQSQTQTEEKPSDTTQTTPQTDQSGLSAKEQIENSDWFKNLQKNFPGTWVDEHGGIHSSVANGDSGDIMG